MAQIRNADVGATVVDQDIYEISSTKKYKLGTRLQRGDKTYRYVKAGESITDTQHCVYGAYCQAINYCAVQANKAATATSITVTVAATDGIGGDGAFTEDVLENGHIVIFTASGEYLNFTTTGNPAKAAGAGTLTIELDGELPIAITTSDVVEGIVTPYLDVKDGNSGGFRMWVGLPMRLLTTTNPYGWVQTWGPCWISPQTAVSAGHDANAIVIRHDGSIDLHDSETTYTENAQHGGFVITHNSGGTQGAPIIFLQINP